MTKPSSTRPIPGLLLGAALLLLGTAVAGAQDLNLAAKVNGEGISRTRLQSSVDASARLNYGGITQPRQFKRVQREILDQLIAQELLWQEAERQGFVATPEDVDRAIDKQRRNYDSEVSYQLALERNGFTEESYREDLKRRMSVWRWANETFAQGITVSDAEVHDFYQANQEKFLRPEQVDVRHVLIRVEPNADEAAVAEARQTIEQILAEAKGGADFAELAKQHSQDSSAADGGDLGFLARRQLVKPFADAAFALQPGELSDVVRTRFGFHIIKLEARREEGTVPEAQAAPSVRDYLSANKLESAIEERARALREEGSVEILMPL